MVRLRVTLSCGIAMGWVLGCGGEEPERPSEGAAAGSAAVAGARPLAGNGGNDSNGSGGLPDTGGGVSGAADASGSPGGSGGASGGAGSGSGGAVNLGGASNAGSTSGGSTSGGACHEAACGSHKWACWKMPNPATAASNAPNQQHYTDLGNGAVRDDVTCLVWEKENPARQGTWQQSFDRCAALAASRFAGFEDWRLPTRIEMASITDVTRGSTGYPALFKVTSGYYVTGSHWYKTILTDNDETAGNETNMVWGYGTNGFTSNAIVRTNTNNVARCVRGGGTGEAAGDYAVEPPNHYTIGAGVVKDNYTDLVWQQGRSESLLAWSEAASYCSALTLDGGGFRLPTLNELATTVNEAKVGGAVVASAFPDNPVGCKAPEYWFWAAEASKVGGDGWGLSYCDGFTGWNAGASGAWNYFPTANVRCVK